MAQIGRMRVEAYRVPRVKDLCMSGFLFNRNAAPAKAATDQEDMARNLRALMEAQSITASAIFALLVSKGVMSGEEAAGYMREIGGVLGRDIDAPLGAEAGDMLARYGEALGAADR